MLRCYDFELSYGNYITEIFVMAVQLFPKRFVYMP
jgi:hypothetical protein